MAFSLKLAVVSATVFSTAVLFKLLTPPVMDFTVSDLPTIWTSLVSWLEPPYLYVVINCIIITIVASSRLQSKLDDSPPPSTVPVTCLLPTEPVKVVGLPVDVPQIIHEPRVTFTGVLNEAVEELTEVQFSGAGYNTGEKSVHVSEPDLIIREFTDEVRDEDIKTAIEAYDEITKNSVDKSVISMSSWRPSKMNQVDFSFPVEKQPASARFSHRKPEKASPDGGRTLGVSKPKRQDTLETTWKTITEGQSVPLTRHLRNSDTWETHGQGRHYRSSGETADRHSDARMTKSDTFDVDKSRKPQAAPSMLSRSGGSGKLKKEPSLGQEELNRRVEAFIKKFNEDMRLQRQESLNQFMEMINRGAH